MSSSALFFAPYKVYINHTDAGGIVYHANHLTFFENCRRDWLTSLGFDGYFFDDTGTPDETGRVHFVVSRAELSYKAPLFVDDVLIVSVSSMIKKPASLILHQHIYQNQAQFEQGKTATNAIITLACVRHGNDGIRPCRLPASFVRAIDELSC